MKVTLSDGEKIYGHKKFKDHLWLSLSGLRKELRWSEKDYQAILKDKDIKKKKIKGRWFIWKKDLKKIAKVFSSTK